MGLSEVRWREQGEVQTANGNICVFSGQEEGAAVNRNGVGIMTDHFKSKLRNVNIAQCYAPRGNSVLV